MLFEYWNFFTVFTIMFITIIKNKIKLYSKPLEVFILLWSPTGIYLQRQRKEISTVKLKSILRQTIKNSSLKIVGRNQIVLVFIMFYSSSLQITRRFLFLVHKEESKTNVCKHINQLKRRHKLQCQTEMANQVAQSCISSNWTN